MIPPIWTPVWQALRIVDVSIGGIAARAGGLRGVFQVDEDEACGAAGVSWLGAHSNGIIPVRVSYNIVSCPNWEALIVPSDIGFWVKDLWLE